MFVSVNILRMQYYRNKSYCDSALLNMENIKLTEAGR